MKRRRRAEFPDFVFWEEHGNPDFVDIVKEAIRYFDFATLERREQDTFRLMKRKGANFVLATLKDDMRQAREEDKSRVYSDFMWANSLGNAIFSHIPDAMKCSFLPMNDVQFEYRDDVIVAKFRSLLTQRSSGGTTYYSRHKPTIEFEGKEYIVGFSTEALRRTCERRRKDPLKYAALGDVYAYFEDCQYFEPCTLRDGSPAFSFFDECFDCSLWLCWAKTILESKEVDPTQGKLYYRVGYCPIAFDQGFAKAKTLLFPGFKKTPEYEALDTAHMSPDTKRDLKRLATDDGCMSRLLETNDVSALKWFHDNGVEQVIQTNKPLFR